jgi:alpha-1,6-mannosyltransferase
LRTALHHLGAGYVAHGHQVVLVVPGDAPASEILPSGIHRITLRAAVIPGTGGYRAVDPWRVRALLDQLRPDRLEVSDRLTLRGMGRWAAEHGVPSVVISHERLGRLLQQFLVPNRQAVRTADWANRRMAASYDTVVRTTAFAREEFDRIGVTNLAQVPLGVDLREFTPCRRDAAVRRDLVRGASTLMVHCGRLPPEKHVERSVDTVAELHEFGYDVRLVIAGDGPRGEALERRAAGDVPGLRVVTATGGDAAGLRSARDVRAGRPRSAGLGDARGRVGVFRTAGDRRPRLRRRRRRPCPRLRLRGDRAHVRSGARPAGRRAGQVT